MQSFDLHRDEIAAKNRVRCFTLSESMTTQTISPSLNPSNWVKASHHPTPSADPGIPILVRIPGMPRYRLHLFHLLQILL